LEQKKKKFVITIDGPAGSGKTTTAKRVARELGFLHLDSGALYRAVTLKVLCSGVDPSDEERVAEIAGKCDLQLKYFDNSLHVYLDGEDVTQEIRTPEVTAAISPVAANAQVRQILTARQRELARGNGVVVEGRDTGTVVFPDADLKIFMVASIEERARRRYEELMEKGIKVDYQSLVEQIRQRDENDRTRKHSPLKKPEDAVVLDTTGLSIDEQVRFVVQKARERGA